MRYSWDRVDEFLDRADDLARLRRWWREPGPPLGLSGRRRVGKSWLLRAFAHGRPAIIFVADSVAERPQLDRFAEVLQHHLPVRPSLPDLPTFFRVLLELGRRRKLLAVIDEFPYLLPAVEGARRQVLQRLQAVLEEERRSGLKLILCGSHISTMESLVAERSPFRGRLVPLRVEPLGFRDARTFFEEPSPTGMVERYAVAGGMPLYIRELGRDRLETRVCRSVLDPRGPLFDEPRAILSQELREPRIYFTILEQLSAGARTLGELAGALRTTASGLTVYLETLQELRIVARRVPVTAPRTARDGHYQLLDPFIAFWFRFVFPYQEDLAAGLDPRRHYRAVIAPRLPEHVAPTFEEICRAWARRRYADRAQRFGPWWGRALDRLRARGARFTEEIDLVGTADRRVTVVGECRWGGRAMDLDVLRDLDSFKVPALRQGGARISRDLQVLLFSRNGFTARLREEARRRGNVRLVEVAEVVGG